MNYGVVLVSERMATGKRCTTVALRTRYDIRRVKRGGDVWECLPYLADTKPIEPKCPPTKPELEAAGLLPTPVPKDPQKGGKAGTPEEEQKRGASGEPAPGELFNKLFELDVEYLKSLDPKDWKNQDHYAVLGLKKMRSVWEIKFKVEVMI